MEDPKLIENLLKNKKVFSFSMNKSEDRLIIIFSDESRLDITPGYGNNSTGGETINLDYDNDDSLTDWV